MDPAKADALHADRVAVGSMSETFRELANVREIRTMTETPNGQGRTVIRIPEWFHRTGLRGFTIDTGLGGDAKCFIPSDKVVREKLKGFEQGKRSREDWEEDKLKIEYVLVLRTIPESWVAEEDGSAGSIVLKAGDPIPQPHTLHSAHPQTIVEYAASLPPSLLQQVYYGMRLMEVPPIVPATKTKEGEEVLSEGTSVPS